MMKIIRQLGTAVGVTISTAVFHIVGLKIGPGEDTLPMYRAAQWTCFTFGVIETILVIVFFRGVGVVGDRAPKPTSVSETEKGKSLDKYQESVIEGKSRPKGEIPAEGTFTVGLGESNKEGKITVTVA